MKNTFTKVLVFLLLALLTLALVPAALAEDAPPADQISSDPTSSYVQWWNPERAAFSISYVDIGIKAGSGSVLISATTESNTPVDCVGGYVRIQQWKNNQWTTIKTYNFYGFDTDSCSMTKSVPVDSGYYYRALGVHTADLDTEYVSKGTTTSSVYVN